MEAVLERDLPGQAVAALREALGDRLVAVVLFGSRARGEAREASDWDLLVIAEDLPPRLLERQLFFSKALWKRCDAGISILAKTPQEFEASMAPLYLDIALDGRILYDQREYATQKLAGVRRLIERLGLHRERTEAGDLWRWDKQPAGAWALRWEG